MMENLMLKTGSLPLVPLQASQLSGLFQSTLFFLLLDIQLHQRDHSSTGKQAYTRHTIRLSQAHTSGSPNLKLVFSKNTATLCFPMLGTLNYFLKTSAQMQRHSLSLLLLSRTQMLLFTTGFSSSSLPPPSFEMGVMVPHTFTR